MQPEARQSGATAAADLPAAAKFLAERGVFGIVWLDDGLTVIDRFGGLVVFVTIGRPVGEALLPLLGLDSQIRALRRKPSRSLDIPNVSINLGEAQSPRININVYWSSRERRYIVLVSRLLEGSDLELELARQIRARSIAESEAAAKAEALARVNAELERANRDLEEFASVISHDLRAPLRGIRYYIGDLEAALSGDDAGEARQCLSRVANQVRRMSEMLNGLLEYSRVGRKHEMLERVDLRELALEIADAIPAPPGLAIHISGPWPVIETLRAPIDLVLRNLVENAVKHHDRTVGRVEVSALDNGGSWTLMVADDGPGISPAWHEGIFHPFRRIGSDDAVEGSGIGLALVKKTVEVVGGRIEVASDPGVQRGTIFRVAWPKVIRV